MFGHLLKIVLLITLMESRTCFYNHTKRCYRLNGGEKVMWNITFTDSQHPDLLNPSVQMQTKGEFESDWVNLSTCIRDERSVECELDDHWSDRYLLRVVRVINTTSMEDLMHHGDDIHHRNGFMCHHNHNHNVNFVDNFTLTFVTSESLNMSWHFHHWDIDHIILISFQYFVCTGANCTYTEGKGHADSSLIYADDDTSLFQSHIISGLKECTSYKFQVIGDYGFSIPKQKVEKIVTTKCKPAKSSKSSVLEIAIPVGGILISGVLFLVYFLTQWRKRGNLSQRRNIIDEDNIPAQQYIQQNFEQDSTDASHHNESYDESSLDEQHLEQDDKNYSTIAPSDLNNQESTTDGQNFEQGDGDNFTVV